MAVIKIYEIIFTGCLAEKYFFAHLEQKNNRSITFSEKFTAQRARLIGKKGLFTLIAQIHSKIGTFGRHFWKKCQTPGLPSNVFPIPGLSVIRTYKVYKFFAYTSCILHALPHTK